VGCKTVCSHATLTSPHQLLLNEVLDLVVLPLTEHGLWKGFIFMPSCNVQLIKAQEIIELLLPIFSCKIPSVNLASKLFDHLLDA